MNPTIVLLAAGMSTRYGRLKQLEAVGPRGESLLDYAVFDAWRSGFSRVVLIIREELEEAFRAHVEPRWPEELEVVYHHQRLEDLPGLEAEVRDDPALAEILGNRKKPWGTGHALLTAQTLLPDPFVLLNADDFYGPSAFAQGLSLMGRELRDNPGDAPVFGLVAYTLEDTLTRHGGVTRGICQVDRWGWLVSVEEVFDVTREGATIRGNPQGGGEILLSGQEPTSTNFWILSPEIFPLLETGFQGFLEERKEQGIPNEGECGPRLKAEPEFLIPLEINRMLAQEEAKVWVLRTHDPFLGITHPQDWEWVARGIRELILEDRYPDPLWASEDGEGSRP